LSVDVGKHLLFKKENFAQSFYGKKPKVVIPNCAQIIPSRYKKGYEENMDKLYIKKMEDVNRSRGDSNLKQLEE
jgi:hypothetical protein